MGGACLRDHCHHWPAGGASRVAAGRNPDALRISLAEDQSDADTVAIGQRLGDSLPIARRHGHAITVAERQRETFELALA